VGFFHQDGGAHFSWGGWRRSPSHLPPWGDGLLEQSLSTLWSRCGWDDVDDDELVLFLPSLAWQGGGERVSGAGPVPYLRRALAVGVYRSQAVLAQIERYSGATSSPDGVLQRIASTGVLTTIDPFTAWAEGRAQAEAFAAPVRRSGPASDRDRWIWELSVLSCLDDLLKTALCSGTRCTARASLADALVASIHASFNAAYVYPEFAPLHETLSVGAWLGHLLAGRAAVMPDFVADRWAGGGMISDDPCEILLCEYAQECIGWNRLRKLADKVKSTGRPLLVTPRRGPKSLPACSWNQALHDRIAARL